jgi:hypothetical protein
MEEIKKELKKEELEQASGGSIFYIESVIRGAGIDLLKEDGTPGEFGYIWNTGDYYFQGKKIDSLDIKALTQYKENHGTPAPSLKAAWDSYKRDVSFQKRRR